ncbi:MAG: histidine kinase [Marinifilum sp.]|jgi:hypothetical protein|nr:histidine kinase [Marinifilum sp.]
MKVKHILNLKTDRSRLRILALLFGLFLAAAIIPLQPIEFEKYIVELQYTPIHHSMFYVDLEGDGKAERFAIKDEYVKSAVYINDDKGKTVDQFNFDYPNVKARLKIKPITIDLNKDGCKEFILFTQSKDSLFLNVIDYKKLEVLVENFFVTKIGVPYRDRYDYYIHTIGSFDANADGVQEFYFGVNSGFGLYPRRIYRYDYPNNQLIASKNTGAGFNTGQIFPNGNDILLLATSASYGNIQSDYPAPYHDSCCWVMGFDKDLNFKFPPKSIGSYPSVTNGFIKRDKYYHFLYSCNNQSNDACRIIKMDEQGNSVDSLMFEQIVGNTLMEVPYKNETICFTIEGTIRKFVGVDIDRLKINRDLPIKKFRQLHFWNYDDIDFDGVYEYFFLEGVRNRVVMYSGNFSYPMYLNYDFDIHPQYITTQYIKEKQSGKIALVSNKKNYEYHFELNPYFHLKYPLWILIYILSVAFLYFLLEIQFKLNAKRQKLEEEISNLQLQNLRNQLDPHFTFNALNSVGNAIYKEDKEVAYDLFQRFTRMIRSSLLVSDKVFRSLGEELMFTRDYLEFQKTRFKERFDYKFEIQNNIDVNDIEIPKMLIQSFTENAVKHAFYGVDYKGLIVVKVYNEQSRVEVFIEDNGIGINKSKVLKATSGTQKGEEIIQDQLKSINRLYNKAYLLDILDKKDKNPTDRGTKVTILL